MASKEELEEKEADAPHRQGGALAGRLPQLLCAVSLFCLFAALFVNSDGRLSLASTKLQAVCPLTPPPRYVHEGDACAGAELRAREPRSANNTAEKSPPIRFIWLWWAKWWRRRWWRWLRWRPCAVVALEAVVAE